MKLYTHVMMALVLAAAAGPLKNCRSEEVNALSNGDACEVIKRTLYPNCRFKLTSSEVDALSEENQTKLSAVKLFFRNCPQAKSCRQGK
jgi:hypothetical protein